MAGCYGNVIEIKNLLFMVPWEFYRMSFEEVFHKIVNSAHWLISWFLKH